MNAIGWLRISGTRQLLWLGFGVLTLVMVAIGLLATLRLRSVASSFEKQTNVASPRSAAVGEAQDGLEAIAIGYRWPATRRSKRR